VTNEPEELFRRCCRLLAGQDSRAVALLPELERFPDYAAGWVDVGRALLSRQPAGALVAFGRAMEAEPSLQAGLGRAAALAALGRHAEAVVAYVACEGMAPADARVTLRLASALRDAGRPDEALEAATRATMLAPGDADGWQALGVIRQDAGDHAGAARAFREALAVRPDFHEAAFNLGVALQEGGDLDAALGAYAAALRLRPDSFGRIAQALVSPRVGKLWLDPSALRRELARR
jgi:tetratricopeptide (TPR) repeat protein